MKTLPLYLCVLCLAGCGRLDDGQTRSRPTYPALNQSPFPPPPLAVYTAPDAQPYVNTRTEVPAEITDYSGFNRDLEKLETINRLRETAAESGPDNPFALTEQELESLYQLDKLLLY